MKKTKTGKTPTKKIECEHCGRQIATTHMKRHQGTWACYQRRLARDLSEKMLRLTSEEGGPLPDDYSAAGFDAAAVVQLAYALGIEDVLRPHYEVYEVQVVITLAAPEWLVSAAHVLRMNRSNPSVVKDVTIVCRYLSEQEDTSLLDGISVALSLIYEADPSGWGSGHDDDARELFRAQANKVIAADPDFALEAATRTL